MHMRGQVHLPFAILVDVPLAWFHDDVSLNQPHDEAN